MSFTIRAACAADTVAMHRVRMNVRENRLPDRGRITPASYLPYVSAGSAWVAEADAGIVGFAVVDAGEASIWALFVDPKWEGAGIGRALHRRMLGWAGAQGIGRLSLTTEAGSRAARFYLQAGWTAAGIAPDGQVLLEKFLLGPNRPSAAES